MNAFKLEAWKKKYPCLREILWRNKSSLSSEREEIPAQEIDSISESTVSTSVLQKAPVYTSWTGSVVNTFHRETFHLVLKDGTIVENFAQTAEDHGSNYAHATRSRAEGETLAEAIDRLEIADRVAWVFNSSRGRDDNNSVEEYRKITLYKWDASSLLALDGIKEKEAVLP